MLARAIFVSGTPLSIVESPLWRDFLNRLRPSYTLPSRKMVSTTLLDKEYAAVKFSVDEQLKNSNVLHLQCDGWSNIRNESIINFVITQPNPFFVDFVPTEENRHTKEYLGKQIEKIIEKYGADKFYSCVGDNAANMQAGLRVATAKYPHIQVFGCKSHTLNLLCKDFLKIPSAKGLFTKAKLIIKRIKKSHRLHSIFLQKQEEKKIKTALKIPPDTRWAFGVQTLDCLIKNKSVLMTMAIDEETNFDTNAMDGTDEIDEIDEMMEVSDDDTEPIDVPGEVKKLILDDNFWKKINSLHDILQPVVASLTKIETDELIIHNAHSILGKMFKSMDALIQSSTAFDAKDKRAAKECLKVRQESTMMPIMLAASILNPSDKGSSLTNEEMMDGMEFIHDSAKSVGLNAATVMTELTNYRGKLDIWKREFVWAGSTNIKPVNWWKGFFAHTELGTIAEKILSTPLTSAATERSFSTIGNIHTKKRNRLTTNRACKITYVAHNYKLMHPKKQSVEGEPSTKRMRYDSESESE